MTHKYPNTRTDFNFFAFILESGITADADPSWKVTDNDKDTDIFADLPRKPMS